jgi:aminomuconate-semialdehyde/2-hydroxymuconate-6-semialdehyde dehydrogenase
VSPVDQKALEKEIVSGRSVAVPQTLKAWLEKTKPLWLGGKPAASGATFEDVNPATEETLSQVALAGEQEVNEAVEAARAAFDDGRWSRLALEKRASVLGKLAELIEAHKPALALLESLDTGKPIREAFEGDIPRAGQNFRFFCSFALEEKPQVFESNGNRHIAQREPMGVVGLVTPWNLPLYLESWKLAPALLMGNSVVLKPSELTPLTAAYLAELVAEAGIPEGVFNLVHGFGEQSAGEFLTKHSGVDAISFTGETGTGRAIMRAAAAGPTRVSFELGGKGASVVFEDADLDRAVAEALRGGFRNQGEICLATPRLFVQESRFSEFLEKFAEGAKQIRVGDPLSYETQMGALISREHWEKVSGYLSKVKAPARFVCGGRRPGHLPKGHYLEPTVVEGLDLAHPISREEVFGPVVSMYPFKDEAQAVRAVNDTPYGLSASLWTSDKKRAERVSRELRHGLVWVNCWFVRDLRVPFGGQKRSGLGREGGTHSLDFYSEWKSVCYSGEGK